MPQLETITPTDERSAVNAMLISIGETTLAASVSIDTAATSYSDIMIAVEILKDTMQEMESMSWKFNSFYGVEHRPTATYNWIDGAGVATMLNIFLPPTNLLWWRLTACRENGDLDMVARMSQKYLGFSGLLVPVLYDRTYNRDGAEASKYPRIFLDVRNATPFTLLPEVARKYIVRKASRALAQRLLGDANRSSFTQGDVDLAMRNLKRDQGEEERHNVFYNPEVSNWTTSRNRAVVRQLRRVRRGGQ